MDTSALDPRKTANVEPAIGTTSEHPSTPEPKLQPPLSFPPQAKPWRLIIHVGAEPVVPVRLEVTGNVIIGRADSTEGYTPTIDLSQHGGRDAGVSRRHAVIFAAENGLFIRDLESTNGTYLNGLSLKPNQPYQLRDGDQIDVGHLHMLLAVVFAPSQTTLTPQRP